jgi:hypothetical protein
VSASLASNPTDCYPLTTGTKLLCRSVADPGSGAFYSLDPGSGTGMNFVGIPDLFDYD